MTESLDYATLNWLLQTAKTCVQWMAGLFVVALIAYAVVLAFMLARHWKLRRKVKMKKAQEAAQKAAKGLARMRRTPVGSPFSPE